MSDIKFICTSCGQKIAVDEKEAGRKLACPGCRTQLTVPKDRTEPPRKPSATRKPRLASPPPDVKPAVPPPAVPPPPSESPATASTRSDTQPLPELPAGQAGASAPAATATATATATVPVPPVARETLPSTPSAHGSGEAGPAAAAEEAPSQAVQVPVLSLDIKRAIIRSVRDRISDADRWMPGVMEDRRLAYAARRSAEGLSRVEVGSEEATHYSLLGAVLLEIQRHNVTPTARGRMEFLDREIPRAIASVLQGAVLPPDEKPPESTDPRLMAASHHQCLEVLDFLEAEYARESRAEPGAAAPMDLRGASLEELMSRATKDELITTTQVLRAVYREWMEIQRRVAACEEALGTTPTATAPAPRAPSPGEPP